MPENLTTSVPRSAVSSRRGVCCWDVVVRLDEFRQSLITTLQKAGLSRGRSADVLRSLTSYILGYTLLGRLRPQQPNRSAPPDSFDLGLEMMMRSLREEVDGPRQP